MLLYLLCTLIGLFIGYIFVTLLRNSGTRSRGGYVEPPIEKGWPILGILPKIGKPMCHYLYKLGERHGDLFRIKFGMRNIYVLNNYNTIKKCLKDDGDNFSGRWKGKLIEIGAKSSGIIFIDGDVWAKQRSFLLKVFRDFGLGKSKTIEIVQEECRHLLLEIEKNKEEQLDFSEKIPIYTLNIITKFIMNKRYEKNDEDFKFIAQLAEMLIKRRDNFLLFHFLFPFWDNSVFLTQISRILSNRKKLMERAHGIFRKEIKKHSEGLDLKTESGDFMDSFLLEQSKIKDKTGSVDSFTEFQLIRSSLELFIAGYETTSTTLVWSLLFLSRHPEIQSKMHDEIVGQIGLDQIPSTNHKKSLPLTQAIMDEILRLSSVSPLSVTHRTFRDTVIDGFFVSGNSLIFPNLYASHRDSRVWAKPFEFYPEHFLMADDNGTMQYNPREELIAFGVGKRQCLGESLARAEYFIFLVAIIQRFRVKLAKNVSEVEFQETLLDGDGFVRCSKIKDFVFQKYE